MSQTKYPLPMRIMHWIMAAIIITLLIVGFLMTGPLADEPYTGTLYFWHKSFGVLVLILITARILMRLNYRHKVPVLAMTMRWYERWLADSVHKLFYVFLVIMPVSGFLTSSFHPKSPGVSFFFGYIPNVFPKNQMWADLFADVHQISAFCILVILFLHVAGVVKHRFFDRPEHDSWRKMW